MRLPATHDEKDQKDSRHDGAMSKWRSNKDVNGFQRPQPSPAKTLEHFGTTRYSSSIEDFPSDIEQPMIWVLRHLPGPERNGRCDIRAEREY